MGLYLYRVTRHQFKFSSDWKKRGAKDPAAGMQHGIPAHGNSIERARTLFNSIKAWLNHSGAADVSTSDGVPLHEMQRFLDAGWEPALVQAEKDWILQRSVSHR